MAENDAISRIKGLEMPKNYYEYYSNLSKETYAVFEKAANAKSSLVDSSAIIEPKIAFDLADRVAKMHEIDRQALHELPSQVFFLIMYLVENIFLKQSLLR